MNPSQNEEENSNLFLSSTHFEAIDNRVLNYVKLFLGELPRENKRLHCICKCEVLINMLTIMIMNKAEVNLF